jgi:fructosamine-3-kinase
LLAVCDRSPDLPQEPLAYTFIVLEYIPPQRPRDEARFIRRFAENLAAMHKTTPLKPGCYGLKNDNFIGLIPQRNTPWSTSWPEFFRDNRLQPQIERAEQHGPLTPERRELLQRVLERTAGLLADIPNEISVIHGDLWEGNFLCADGDEPVVFDPSAYFGHREMEMAYVELFGGFPPDFVVTYNTIAPLDAGYARRRPLHQLYHLLNHGNHFGEQYGPAVERVCREIITLA